MLNVAGQEHPQVEFAAFGQAAGAVSAAAESLALHVLLVLLAAALFFAVLE